MHSAKDVPGEDVPGLLIVAVPERVDPRDMLLGAESLERSARRRDRRHKLAAPRRPAASLRART